MWGGSAYVGLASPGEAGSWQRENKVDKAAGFFLSKLKLACYEPYFVNGFQFGLGKLQLDLIFLL